ncbi:hypothetical protein GCM10009759_44550 [Kitasatospora saccharophila]|uniref:Uncharacterized protein n=1 Tax=Kitasatospora saccharophila TaxID=407973 RepID=A0ABN2X9C5_9ACTN
MGAEHGAGEQVGGGGFGRGEPGGQLLGGRGHFGPGAVLRTALRARLRAALRVVLRTALGVRLRAVLRACRSGGPSGPARAPRPRSAGRRSDFDGCSLPLHVGPSLDAEPGTTRR